MGLGLLILLLAVGFRDDKGECGRGLGGEGLVVTTPSGPTTLASLAGKPTVLVFWATWCGACVDELPELDRLARDGYSVLAISREPLSRTSAVVKKRGLQVPIASDPTGKIFVAFGVEVLPTVIIFDTQGRPAHTERGAASYESLRAQLGPLAE